GSQHPAIGTEGDGVDRSLVAAEGGQLASRLDIPQLDGGVGAPRGQYLTIRRNRHAVDSIGIPAERGALIPLAAPPEATRPEPAPARTRPRLYAAFCRRTSASGMCCHTHARSNTRS